MNRPAATPTCFNTAMNEALSIAGTLLDLLLVIAGFGFIIFLHELGHYLAARWAGIRVLAFALGFGAAMASWRKGMGLRRGSGEAEYLERVRAGTAAGISPTEYRLNVLPLGGYVKMLGQDDLNPGDVSTAPDSYQSCRPWKRMVVISAGVAMNIATAAVLYILVFMVGLRTEPARIGFVMPGGPAESTLAEGNPGAGALRGGDTVVRVNGRMPRSFNDLILAGAMSRRGDAVTLDIEREGSPALRYEIVPEVSEFTNLLDLGILPMLAPTLRDPSSRAEREAIEKALAIVPGLRPGMRLTRIGADSDVEGAHELVAAMERGEPVEVEFNGEGVPAVRTTLEPVPLLDAAIVELSDGAKARLDHLFGLTPVLRVGEVEARAEKMGLREGDVFARLGGLEFPSVADGISEIRRNAGKNIPVVVRRETPEGPAEVALSLSVTRSKPRIGFVPEDTAAESALLAASPERLTPRDGGDGEPAFPAAAAQFRHPGAVIVGVGGTTVETLLGVREAVREQTRGSLATGSPARVELAVRQPGSPGTGESRTIAIDLSPDDVARVHSLSWRSPLPISAFDTLETMLVADSPIDAIGMGIAETHRVMLLTYATFARLYEGTVKVEHLKGPVGIAHVGTRIASKGPIWLLFFMALISINLAVVNFLPLPIVDGGQFIFLLIEQVRGRPVPIAIQNMATLVGIILIGSMFLLVTFNDIAGLFAG